MTARERSRAATPAVEPPPGTAATTRQMSSPGRIGAVVAPFAIRGLMGIVAQILLARLALGEVQTAAPLAFLPPDAQGSAMGEAYTALARGPEAAWWNPAALALGSGLRGIPYSRSDRLQPWGDARLNHFTAAWGGGGLGIGGTWCRYEFPSIIAVRYDPNFTPWIDRYGWTRQVATAGLGIDISRFAVSLPRAARIALGASARGYRDERPHEASTRHDGWDVDGAALLTWRLAEPSRPDEEQNAPGITSDLSVGYVAMNALDRDGATETGKLPLGRRDRAGAALTLRVPVHWPLVPWFNLSAAVERRGFLLRAGREDPAVDHIGGEISLGGVLALRAGQVRDPLREGLGGNERRFTWGGGLSLPAGGAGRGWPGIALDFADLGDRSLGGSAKQVTVAVRFR